MAEMYDGFISYSHVADAGEPGSRSLARRWVSDVGSDPEPVMSADGAPVAPVMGVQGLSSMKPAAAKS